MNAFVCSARSRHFYFSGILVVRRENSTPSAACPKRCHPIESVRSSVKTMLRVSRCRCSLDLHIMNSFEEFAFYRLLWSSHFVNHAPEIVCTDITVEESHIPLSGSVLPVCFLPLLILTALLLLALTHRTAREGRVSSRSRRRVHTVSSVEREEEATKRGRGRERERARGATGARGRRARGMNAKFFPSEHRRSQPHVAHIRLGLDKKHTVDYFSLQAYFSCKLDYRRPSGDPNSASVSEADSGRSEVGTLFRAHPLFWPNLA